MGEFAGKLMNQDEWVRDWLVPVLAVDVILWLPSFSVESLAPLAGSGVSNVGEWIPRPSGQSYSPSPLWWDPKGVQVMEQQAGEQEEERGRQKEAVAACRSRSRNSPAESAASPAGLVMGAQGTVLGQGEKGVVGRPLHWDRSRLLGEGELKVWIKQNIRANVWKGRKWTGRVLACTYVDVGFLGVVPFKCN